MRGLPQLISQESMYDEAGHVDTQFLTAVIGYLSELTELSIDVERSLCALLGIDRMKQGKSTMARKKDGDKMTAEAVLAQCIFSDNVLRLPDVQLHTDTYQEVKKRIAEAGGKWQGGSVQGFTFKYNAARVVAALREKGRCNLKKDFQFFATPDKLADRIVELAEIRPGHKILEPSAGDGSIVRAIHRKHPEVFVDCYELMPENQELLSAIEGCRIVGEDFLEESGRSYDRIVANPPFTANSDIVHVSRMYGRLYAGGRLVSVMSRHWAQSNERTCVDFRNFLDENGAEVYPVDEGVFHESGTDIATCIVVINKQ